jgi:signal peptidase I
MGCILHTRKRTTAEAVVRLQLLLLPPVVLALIGAAASRGGPWLVLLLPSALLLAGHARLVARFGSRSWTGALGNLALLVGSSVLLAFAVGPAFGLYRTVTVLSGSMRPTFRPGDVILVTPQHASSLRLGEIITYQIPVNGRPVETHRVVRILQHGSEPIVETKGDANRTADPWQAKLHGGTLWRYRLRLPLLGYPLLALRAPLAHRLLIYVVPALLAVYFLGRLWLPNRPPRLAHAPSET